MLFLHGWLFRLKCHCLCSFSLMFLLNFTHLTCSVHKIWIILTDFTRPPCVSTCTHENCTHKQTQHAHKISLLAPLWRSEGLAMQKFMMAFTKTHQMKYISTGCIKGDVLQIWSIMELTSLRVKEVYLRVYLAEHQNGLFVLELCCFYSFENNYSVWAYHTFKSFIQFTSSKWLLAVVVLIVEHNPQSALIYHGHTTVKK